MGTPCRSGFRFREPVLLDPRAELRAREAQELRGARLVVLARARALMTSDRSMASRFTPPAGSGALLVSAADGTWLRRVDGQVLAADVTAVGQDDGALDRACAARATLPGHGYAIRSRRASRSNPAAGRPIGLADLAEEHVRELQHRPRPARAAAAARSRRRRDGSRGPRGTRRAASRACRSRLVAAITRMSA